MNMKKEIYDKYMTGRYSQMELALEYGISQPLVYKYLLDCGYRPTKDTGRKFIDKRLVRNLYYEQGLTQISIAEKLGISQSSVSNCLRSDIDEN